MADYISRKEQIGKGGRTLRNEQWPLEKRQKKKTNFLLPSPGPSEKGPEKWQLSGFA